MKCLFNSNQYPYVWSTTPQKSWKQRKCPRCALYTVYTHKKTGESVSQCEGVETFWAKYNAIEKHAKEYA